MADAATAETTDTETDATGNADTAPEESRDETFGREYVEELRRESQGYRDRAKTAEARVEELQAAESHAEELAHRLHTALVAATGKLADPSDLAFAAEHLDDTDALTSAVDALIESKPHLKARKVSGTVGQGVKGDQSEQTGWLAALKSAS